MSKYKFIFLVDTENVGFPDIGETFNDKNILIIYFINNSHTRNNKLVDCLHNNVKVIKFNALEHDSLDFILDSYLGYLLCQNGNKCKYYIYSNDKGFDVISNFWKKYGYSIKRINNLTGDYKDLDRDSLIKLLEKEKKKTKKLQETIYKLENEKSLERVTKTKEDIALNMLMKNYSATVSRKILNVYIGHSKCKDKEKVLQALGRIKQIKNSKSDVKSILRQLNDIYKK